MAKRKRLTPANPALFGTDTQTTDPLPPSRAPIADVASDAAATAALDQVTQELSAAREGGRMVLEVSLSDIVLDHLVRDRIVADDAEMEALITSIEARGQQTPVDVVQLPAGQYGLISGWRRCQAIATLAEDGRHPGTVLALLRRPTDASEAYLSMVEENEIRVGLSYFERARIAKKAVEHGVFETEKAALLSLFASASRPKRSKIRTFLSLVAVFDGSLGFPQAIGERLGLRLAAALERDHDLADRILMSLREEMPESTDAEQGLLQRCIAESEMRLKQSLNTKLETKQPSSPEPIPQGSPGHDDTDLSNVRMHLRADLDAVWDENGAWLRLEGAGMTPALRLQIIDLIQQLPSRDG